MLEQISLAELCTHAMVGVLGDTVLFLMPEVLALYKYEQRLQQLHAHVERMLRAIKQHLFSLLLLPLFNDHWPYKQPLLIDVTVLNKYSVKQMVLCFISAGSSGGSSGQVVGQHSQHG